VRNLPFLHLVVSLLARKILNSTRNVYYSYSLYVEFLQSGTQQQIAEQGFRSLRGHIMILPTLDVYNVDTYQLNFEERQLC